MFKNLDALVYKIQNNSLSFLQGLSANVLTAKENVFVDKNGKIIATFQHKTIESDVALIIVSAYARVLLEKHFFKYSKLTKTVIQEVRHYHVYIDYYCKHKRIDNEIVFEGSWAPVILSPYVYHNSDNGQEFLEWRVKKEMPLHGVDYTNEMVLNVHASRYVDFNKGCFLGQEVLSRVHHKGTIPWKLTVLCQKDCPSELWHKMTSVHERSSDKQMWGFLFCKNNRVSCEM